MFGFLLRLILGVLPGLTLDVFIICTITVCMRGQAFAKGGENTRAQSSEQYFGEPGERDPDFTKGFQVSYITTALGPEKCQVCSSL